MEGNFAAGGNLELSATGHFADPGPSQTPAIVVDEVAANSHRTDADSYRAE